MRLYLATPESLLSSNQELFSAASISRIPENDTCDNDGDGDDDNDGDDDDDYL